ncbi:MAG: hypothetical protein J6D03_02605 [Clostridia bacterium]|nr:hypothetical protein [Clostridia bacterium]
MESKEDLKRIEQKLDKAINFFMENESNIIQKQCDRSKRKIQNENRRKIDEILTVLPELERFSNLENLTNKEIEEITDNYISSVIMGIKNQNATKQYLIDREDIKERLRTKFHVNRIHNILDTYLQSEQDNKLNPSKKSESNNLDAFNIKKVILRRIYGYKLLPNEEKAKSREQLAEDIGYSTRWIYKYQNELLDDLAPSFFGVKGLIL